MSVVQARALSIDEPAVEREWRRLEQAGGVSSPFQTWSWLSTIKDHADAFGDLTVVAAVQNDVVIGLLAVEIFESRWRLRTLQAPGQDWIVPDHLDVVGAEEHRSVAACAIADWIFANRGWDVLDLDGLRRTSPLVSAVLARRRPVAQFAQKTDAATCPQVGLETGRDPLESRSQRTRKRIRRDLKRLADNGGRSGEITQSAGESRAAMLFQIQTVRDKLGADAAVFNSDQRREFFVDLAERLRTAGELRWFATQVEGEFVAAEAALVQNGQFYNYMGAYKNTDAIRSPGTITALNMYRTASVEGCVNVDLLRGEHPYKFEFATGQIVDVRVRIARLRARTLFGYAIVKLPHGYHVLKDRSRGSHPNLRSRVGSAIERRVLDIQRARVLTLSLESATHEPPCPPKKVSITRHAGEVSNDTELSVAFGSSDSESIRQQRLRGDVCYAAWIDNSLASYLWVSTAPHRDPYSGSHINLRCGEAYIYDLRTIPEARRKGLARLLLQHALSEMKSPEITTVHTIVDNWNTASLRLFDSFGFESSGSVSSARILGRYAVQIPTSAKPRASLCNAARPMGRPTAAQKPPFSQSNEAH